MKAARVLHATSAFPEKVLSNQDLEKMVDTNDQWITERTGIKERRIVGPGQASSDLATEAVNKLLQDVGVKADDVDAIIVATVTPDSPAPSTACILQKNIGAKRAWALDLNAACSGFIFALSVATQYLKLGQIHNCIVVGVDVMSSILDFTDRATCILFGDGAGAVFLQSDSAKQPAGVIDTLLWSDGEGSSFLYMPAGGSRMPASQESVENRMHFIRQDGANVFKAAVTQMAKVSEDLLKRNEMSSDDLDFFVAHQANLRIIDSTAKRLSLPAEKIVLNIAKYGNTTAATIPSCLADICASGDLSKGKHVLLAAFGAGYTAASALIEWG